MEDFNSYYSTHLSRDTTTDLRDQLQPSHPIEDMPETSRASPDSTSNEEATFLNTNTEMSRTSPPMLSAREEQQEEVKDCNNESVMEQAERLDQINLESNDSSLGKPIRSYLDESLPDLLRSGSPLRRRVSSPVSDTVRY